MILIYSDDFCVKCICTTIASRTPPLTCKNNYHTNLQQQYRILTRIHEEDVRKSAMSIVLHALLLLLRKDRSVRGPDSVLNHHGDDVHRAGTEILDVAKTANFLMLSTKLAFSFRDDIHNPVCSAPLHSRGL